MVVLFVGVVASLAALELGLRLVGAVYWRQDADPAVFAGTEGARVLCIGDSFTYGVGASPNMDYPSQLQALLDEDPTVAGAKVVNGGIGASNSRQALQRLGLFAAAGPLDLVVVMTGPRNSDNLQGFAEATHTERAIWDRLRIVRFARFVGSEGLSRRVRGAAGATASDGEAYLRWHTAHGGLDLAEDDLELFRAGAEQLHHAVYAEAEATFAAGLERAPESAAHHWGMGKALRGQHRLGAASKILREGILLAPGDPYLYVALAEVTHDLGLSRTNGAAWMRQGLAEEGDCAALHCSLSSFLHGAERFERAAVGARLDPDEALCYQELVWGAEEAKQLEPLYDLLEELSEASVLARSHREILLHQDRDQAVQEWLISDLGAIADQCEAHGAALIFQRFPHLNFREELAPSALANRCMTTVARERGLPVADSHPAFEEYYLVHGMGPGLFLANGHPNDRGYGLMAAAVLQVIRDEKLLTRSGGDRSADPSD